MQPQQSTGFTPGYRHRLAYVNLYSPSAEIP
jgi:hypothetical protein